MKPQRTLGLIAGLFAMASLSGFGRPSIFPTPPDPEPEPEPEPEPVPEPEPEPEPEPVVPKGAILIPEFAAVAEHCPRPIMINVRAPNPAEVAAAEKRARRAGRKNPSKYASSNA